MDVDKETGRVKRGDNTIAGDVINFTAFVNFRMMALEAVGDGGATERRSGELLFDVMRR